MEIISLKKKTEFRWDDIDVDVSKNEAKTKKIYSPSQKVFDDDWAKSFSVAKMLR